jgi:hypothetical protein
MLIVQISWVKMLVQTQQLQITQISLVLVIVQQLQIIQISLVRSWLSSNRCKLKFHGLKAVIMQQVLIIQIGDSAGI